MPPVSGDKKAVVQELIQTKTEVLFSAARGMGFSEADAEELVQVTFVGLLESIERFEGRSQLSTFLFSIFYHKAANLRRQHYREDSSTPVEELFDQQFDRFGFRRRKPDGPEEAALNSELSQWIERCSEGLTPEQRMAFYLKTVEDQPTEAICKILGVTTTNLGVLLFRARNRLRDCLEKNWKKRL
jgi:RNA polymerase sigma-70 factor (ECF subfamily)